MCVNNLAKVATQWNSGATFDFNRGHRARIPSALTTRPLSHTIFSILYLFYTSRAVNVFVVFSGIVADCPCLVNRHRRHHHLVWHFLHEKVPSN